MGIWANNTTDYSNVGASNTMEFAEVPDGTYLCSVVSMELGQSKRTGMPMIKTQFKIMDGEYANMRMFSNRLVLRSLDKSTDDSFLVHLCNEFLESFHVVDCVKLENLAQYEATVDYIAGSICNPVIGYQVEKVTRKGFTDYQIVQGPIQLEQLTPVEAQPDNGVIGGTLEDFKHVVATAEADPAFAASQSAAIPEPGAPLPGAEVQTGDDIPF